MLNTARTRDALLQDITPLIKQAPAAVGLTPRTENLTPRGMDHGLMPRMTPRTRSTMDEMLQDKSLGEFLMRRAPRVFVIGISLSVLLLVTFGTVHHFGIGSTRSIEGHAAMTMAQAV